MFVTTQYYVQVGGGNRNYINQENTGFPLKHVRAVLHHPGVSIFPLMWLYFYFDLGRYDLYREKEPCVKFLKVKQQTPPHMHPLQKIYFHYNNFVQCMKYTAEVISEMMKFM